jgi:hypothetical protein
MTPINAWLVLKRENILKERFRRTYPGRQEVQMSRARLKQMRAGLFLLAMAAALTAGAAFEPDWATVGVFSTATECGICHRASPDQDPIQPAFVHGLSSETDRVEVFKTLYRDNPPATEPLASASTELDVANGADNGGGDDGGGCSLNSRSVPDPLLLLILLALWRWPVAGPAARFTRDQYRGKGIRPCAFE